MRNRTLLEVLADHNITPLTDDERNVIKWQHLRASVAYPRYFMHRYAKWTFPFFVTSIISGLIFLIIAGVLTVMFAQTATVFATIGLVSLSSAALVFAMFVLVDEFCDERAVYWNQRLYYTEPADRANIPEQVLEHIDSLTHPMGSDVEVSIEGDSTVFSDCILVHYTCWVSTNNPLQIVPIASWEVAYKVSGNEAT